jgi:1-phosphatidylinositol-4-phosphate 5-kinase
VSPWISLVDLLLSALYVFQYDVTEMTRVSVALPFRTAALTQALLLCGEFWFFAIPIDMVKSVTNPFTSYSYNFRVYWFYSVVSGAIFGAVLWYLGDAEAACESNGNTADCVDHQRISSTATDSKEDGQRFIWFHHNTDMPGFFWHEWIVYHLFVLVYLLFGIVCMIYVKRRLSQGLEETFEVRRRVVANGMLTCGVYISWSFITIFLFTMTNSVAVKHLLGTTAFKELINVSAFLHSARGCVNMVVWLVVNAPYLSTVCFYPLERDYTGSNQARWKRARHGVASGESSSATSTSQSFASVGGVNSNRGFNSMNDFSQISASSDSDEVDGKMKPQLNTALQKQMIHMATSGIIESVQLYHRLHTRIENNHTFDLDWQRSPQRKMRQILHSPPNEASLNQAPLSAPANLMPTRMSRNSIVHVVEARGRTSTPRFTFLPMAMREMQFYDFQPRVFASVRQLYGVDDREYMFAFRYTMNERISEGRSGAFVFNTCDRKYLVKSTTSAEKDVLLGLLPSYMRYLKWNPDTLLPRFYGLHAMKMYGQIFFFVVMNNIMSSPDVIHRRYDIKGSWEDRNAPACVLGDKYRCSKCNRFFVFGSGNDGGCTAPGEEHYPDVTLRDNDLKKRLKLETGTAVQLLKQLTRDSDFLASAGIMDYSLLIGTHYSHFTITSTRHKKRPTPTQANRPGEAIGNGSSVPSRPNGQSSPLVSPGGTRQLDEAGENGEHSFNHDQIQQQQQQESDNQNPIGEFDSGADSEASCERTSLDASSSVDFGLDMAAAAAGGRVSGRTPYTHSYDAHQVSGPSKYYFGLVDVLQQWTMAKQAERVYKVHVLRKSGRGLSAIAPRPYARRFQRKMRQLFITNPAQFRSFDHGLDDEPDDMMPAMLV